ncbi:MAG: prolyl oligopeptidase family serine peptidase [Terriglobia bacterium]
MLSRPIRWKGLPLPMMLLVILFAYKPAEVCAQMKPLAEPEGASRIKITVAGREGFILKPVSPPPRGGPWVWYAPTLLSKNLPNSMCNWLFGQLLQVGISIAGIDVGESCGDPVKQNPFEAFYNHLVTDFNLSPKPCILVQSRGGLMLLNWAADHPENVAAIAGIYPVCDVTSWPGPNKYTEYCDPLSESEFRQLVSAANPIDRLTVLARNKVPVFFIHGDHDNAVPLGQNSLAFVTRYKELGGDAALKIVKGWGHTEIPAYFEDPDLRKFIIQTLNK